VFESKSVKSYGVHRFCDTVTALLVNERVVEWVVCRSKSKSVQSPLACGAVGNLSVSNGAYNAHQYAVQWVSCL